MQNTIGQLADDTDNIDMELGHIHCLLDSMYQEIQAGIADTKHLLATAHILKCHIDCIRSTNIASMRKCVKELGWNGESKSDTEDVLRIACKQENTGGMGE